MGDSKLTQSHTALESNGILFPILTTIAVLVGGAVEVFPPLFMSPALTVKPIESVKPYSALELTGRHIYIREGCNSCHTQMIRPFKWETDRFDPTRAYGDTPYSKGGEYVYDYPFLWGSKRTGPDLAHEATIRPSEAWQKAHLIDPQETSPGSVMPAYPWLFKREIDADRAVRRMEVHRTLHRIAGKETYSDDEVANAASEVSGKTEGDALVAYLLSLGRDTVVR